MKNVLVFPCGSEIGLEIGRSLRSSTHFRPIGASSVDDHGRFAFSEYVGGLPHVSEDSFIDAVNDVVERRSIAWIMPAHDDVVLALARADSRGQLRCGVVGSPLRTCEVARSKRATYEALADVVPVPRLFEQPPDSVYPVFMKPDAGQGSKGVEVGRSATEVLHYRDRDPSLLIMEYLPGAEYTVDCFSDRHGDLRFCQGRERLRITNGISVRSHVVDDERFRSYAESISNTLPFRGTWFFQVKANAAGDLCLMEIAPRVAGTMALARCRGANLPLLSLFDAEGMDVEIMLNEHELVLDRALTSRFEHALSYRHVYIDLDDLILCGDAIDTVVIAFLFQCLNKGISLHLITRHRGDLEATLTRYRIAGIFDDLIFVPPGHSKTAHIKERDAIFIDDSFIERKQVREACGIPVFDAHMIESLLEL